MPLNPKVIDITHWETIPIGGVGGGKPFDQLKQFGILGVIHKATQGVGVQDPTYVLRRQWALDQGLLWGAYHFNTGDPIVNQVANFLGHAQPDANTLCALDFEDNAVSEMSIEEAAEFLIRLGGQLGRQPVLYGGDRLKELLPKASDEVKKIIVAHRLWLAQYSAKPKLPPGFKSYWLWQFTGDGAGPAPHIVPGIRAVGGIDINSYDGDDDELAAEWAGAPLIVATEGTDDESADGVDPGSGDAVPVGET
jgi:GH25 family lysozyme M1 (1,4-beta-N-acetylmuramidase)